MAKIHCLDVGLLKDLETCLQVTIAYGGGLQCLKAGDLKALDCKGVLCSAD